MFTMLVDRNIGINIQGSSVIPNVFCCTTKRGFQASGGSVDVCRACVKEMLRTWNGFEKSNNKRPIFVKAFCCTK